VSGTILELFSEKMKKVVYTSARCVTYCGVGAEWSAAMKRTGITVSRMLHRSQMTGLFGLWSDYARMCGGESLAIEVAVNQPSRKPESSGVTLM
jgi:hypothetical protein